eukprot:scaffold108535_cov63-Phaeocystis_antarctica.AAC.1
MNSSSRSTGKLWPLPAALLVDGEGGWTELLGAVPTRLEVGRHVVSARDGCRVLLAVLVASPWYVASGQKRRGPPTLNNVGQHGPA